MPVLPYPTLMFFYPSLILPIYFGSPVETGHMCLLPGARTAAWGPSMVTLCPWVLSFISTILMMSATAREDTQAQDV